MLWSLEYYKINNKFNNPAVPATAFQRHLRNPIEMPRASHFTAQNLPNESKLAKKRKITEYSSSSDTMETVVTRMIALDGLSLRIFTESQDLRDLFHFSGFNLPKSTKSILKIIVSKVEDIKEDIKKTIADMKTSGHKFTLALDEWTSTKNKCFINITLYCKAMNTSIALGPINITNSTSSIATFTSLNHYLNTYNVSIQDDIVSLTTDGSSDMKKIGIHFPGHHQWCLAQGVQAAVINTMYRPLPKKAVTKTQMDIDDSSDASSESDNESIANQEFEISNQHKQSELQYHKEVIEKLRAAVNMIKGSHLNTTKLQEYVRKDLNGESQLQRDNQKSWTSMIDMIGSFFKEKGCISALLHEKSIEIAFTEEELTSLSEIYFNLDLMRQLVQFLLRENATLFTADTALRRAVLKLEEQNTDLSVKLAKALRKQIKERRLPIAGVLHYLHDLKSFGAFPDNDITFLKPNNQQITDLIVSLLKQLKFKYVAKDSNKILVPASTKHSNKDTTVLIYDQKIELTLIKNRTDQSLKSIDFDLHDMVYAERIIYESQGEKGICLSKAYEYLSSVMPTNVQPDKIFTVCGCVSNRIESSHPDKVLEDLIFLRTYYTEQRRNEM